MLELTELSVLEAVLLVLSVSLFLQPQASESTKADISKIAITFLLIESPPYIFSFNNGILGFSGYKFIPKI